LVEKYLDLKEKELVNSINLTNFGIYGLIFVSIIIFVNRQSIDYYSGTTWAVLALGYSFTGGALIWGLVQFRAREVHLKNDNKTKRITGLEILLNALGLILAAIGQIMIYYFEKQDYITPDGLHVIGSKPYLFQGIAIFAAGMIILFSTIYLYNRFIPQQVIKEPEMGNTQTVSLH
jgi:hypothetical protein